MGVGIVLILVRNETLQLEIGIDMNHRFIPALKDSNSAEFRKLECLLREKTGMISAIPYLAKPPYEMLYGKGQKL